MARATKLATLKGCLILPLIPAERSLIRDLAFAYERGQERVWGAANQHRADEVRALFQKCEKILAPHASV